MTSKLMFACRTCQFSEEAQSSCVFRNNLFNTVGETAGVTQDVGNDPTVGHTTFDAWPCCLLCGMDMMAEEAGESIDTEVEDDGWRIFSRDRYEQHSGVASSGSLKRRDGGTEEQARP